MAWFLALYVAPAWQWPVIAVMALIGLSMYALGGLMYWQARNLDPLVTVGNSLLANND